MNKKQFIKTGKTILAMILTIAMAANLVTGLAAPPPGGGIHTGDGGTADISRGPLGVGRSNDLTGPSQYISGVRLSIGYVEKGAYDKGILVTQDINPISISTAGGWVMSLTSSHSDFNWWIDETFRYSDGVAQDWMVQNGRLAYAGYHYVKSSTVREMQFENVGAPALSKATVTDAQAFQCVARILEMQPYLNTAVYAPGSPNNQYVYTTLKDFGFTDKDELPAGQELTDVQIENNVKIFRAFAEVIYQYGGGLDIETGGRLYRDYAGANQADQIRRGDASIDNYDFFLVVEPVSAMSNYALDGGNRTTGEIGKRRFMVTAYAALRMFDMSTPEGKLRGEDQDYSWSILWDRSRNELVGPVAQSSMTTSQRLHRWYVGDDNRVNNKDGTITVSGQSRPINYLASTIYYTGPTEPQGKDRANYDSGYWGFGTVAMTVSTKAVDIVDIYIDEDFDTITVTERKESSRNPSIPPIEYLDINNEKVPFNLLTSETSHTQQPITNPLTAITYDEYIKPKYLTSPWFKTSYPPGEPSPNELPKEATTVYNVYQGKIPNYIIEIYLDQDYNDKGTPIVYEMPTDRKVTNKAATNGNIEYVSSNQTKSIITNPMQQTRFSHLVNYADKEWYEFGDTVKSKMNAYSDKL